MNECASEFQSLARRAFCSKLLFNLPILSGGWLRKAREILLSFITDSLYGSTGITSAVQLAYRDQRQLLGNSSGTKTAVTATTTEKSSTVVFSNYSGPDQSDNCGMYKPQSRPLGGLLLKVTASCGPGTARVKCSSGRCKCLSSVLSNQ